MDGEMMASNNLKLKPRLNIEPSDPTESDEENNKENEVLSEGSLNDILSALKDKQEEFSQMIADYSIFDKRTLIDLIETTDSIIIKADLPRLKSQDIEIAISEDNVDICAEMEEETLDSEMNYIQRERSYGKIKRSINLPSKVRASEAEGTFNNSVLTIKLPKLEKNILKLKID
jgi:HSP20 family protein